MNQPNIPWKKRTILFLASQGITALGSAIVQMAIIWYVTLETSSGAWVSALTICSCVPQMIISPFSGVWADRYNRKLLIILADSVIAVATLTLALLFPYLSNNTAILTAILVVSVIRSLGSGVQSPAVGAMIPQLVPEEHLMRFNGINATLQSIIQFASPAAAALILSMSVFRSVLFLDVSTAVVGIGLLAGIALPPIEKPVSGEKTSFFSEMKAGIVYAFSNSVIGLLLLVFGAFIFLSVPSGFLSALLVTRTFGEDYLFLTIVEMVGFIGMTACGLLIGTWGGFKNRNLTLLAGIAVYAVFAIVAGLIRNFVLFTVAMFFMSSAIPMVQIAVTTLIQEKADPNVHGRVFSLLGIAYSGFLPIGMAVFGPAADHVSVQTLMIITGSLLLIFAILLKVNRSFYNRGESGQTKLSTPETDPAGLE